MYASLEPQTNRPHAQCATHTYELCLGQAAPKQFDPTKKRLGVGRHPHRGFETVTVAFQGAVEHQDSSGNNDVIGPGDVQWMTAGRGVIHEEYHSTEFAKTGGIFEMAQLWLNLPKKHKMHAPRYQPILSEAVPVVQLKAREGDGGVAVVGSVRVIAGELEGVRGPTQTLSPVLLWDALLTPAGAVVELAAPKHVHGPDAPSVRPCGRAAKPATRGSRRSRTCLRPRAAT